MQISDIKEFFAKLPPQFDEYGVIIVEAVSIIENNPGRVLVKHSPVVTVAIDETSKEMCIFNAEMIDKYDSLIGHKDENKH